MTRISNRDYYLLPQQKIDPKTAQILPKDQLKTHLDKFRNSVRNFNNSLPDLLDIHPEIRFGVAIAPLDPSLPHDFEPFTYGDSVFKAASINKLAVEAVVIASKNPSLDDDTVMNLRAEDRMSGGYLYYVPEGTPITIRDARLLMLSISDNTATRLIIRALGGPDEVNDRLGKNGLGFEHTRLEVLSDKRIKFGTTTPTEAVELMRFASTDETSVTSLARNDWFFGLRFHLEPFFVPCIINSMIRYMRNVLIGTHKLTPINVPLNIFGELAKYPTKPQTEYPNKQGCYGPYHHEAAMHFGSNMIAVVMSESPRPCVRGKWNPAFRVMKKIGKTVFQQQPAYHPLITQ